MLDLIVELEGDGHTWQQVADAVGEAFLAAADITRDAVAATPPPIASTRRGRPTTWTCEQLGRFLDFVADSPYLPAWLHLAASGSRRGEVFGLKWTEVDLDNAWIFCRADGTRFHPERFSREFLRKQYAHNKAHPGQPLPRLKLHGLRHTWATLALEEGIDIHVVSDRLGHSSTHITSEIYTQVRRPLQSDAATESRRGSSGQLDSWVGSDYARATPPAG